ncbi:MAG: TetR family transcriptional regulator [Deltaproteobacteria bacterium]|nr:TetR family transcriptional regulator [Deltaproteobacteria bacterium]
MPNRRDRQKLTVHQALSDPTDDLLASRSMDLVSVDEIAMRADLAKRTFHTYFRGTFSNLRLTKVTNMSKNNYLVRNQIASM